MEKELNAVEVYKEVCTGKRMHFPNKFWKWYDIPNYSAAKEITIYLIEEKLCWNDEEIKKNLSSKIFYDNGLSGMLQIVFNGSVYGAIENAYPGKFKEWELPRVLRNYWNKETAREATLWLIEEKLGLDDEQLKKRLNKKIFYDNCLSGMLKLVFNGSPYYAIENAYPGKFKEWELSRVLRNYWNKKTAREATLWLFEEKLGWNEEQIRNNLNKKIFKENGLGGMLKIVFNNNIRKAIENAYPNIFN